MKTPSNKYKIPEWLIEKCQPTLYQRWLARKAATHCKRDRLRYASSQATVASYKAAIHEAVVNSNGKDAYTGEEVDWTLVNTYTNHQSKTGRRQYKHSLSNLPTVDHVGDGSGPPDFRICSWRTNDAKHDLSYDDFVKLCRSVIQYADSQIEQA